MKLAPSITRIVFSEKYQWRELERKKTRENTKSSLQSSTRKFPNSIFFSRETTERERERPVIGQRGRGEGSDYRQR